MKRLFWLTLLLTACSTPQDAQRAEAARQDWTDFTCCPPDSFAPGATPGAMGEWQSCEDEGGEPWLYVDPASHDVPQCCGEDCYGDDCYGDDGCGDDGCGDGFCEPQMCQDLADQDLPACCGHAGCTCTCRPLAPPARPIDR